MLRNEVALLTQREEKRETGRKGDRVREREKGKREERARDRDRKST
jgi:hypothetical protein